VCDFGHLIGDLQEAAGRDATAVAGEAGGLVCDVKLPEEVYARVPTPLTVVLTNTGGEEARDITWTLQGDIKQGVSHTFDRLPGGASAEVRVSICADGEADRAWIWLHASFTTASGEAGWAWAERKVPLNQVSETPGGRTFVITGGTYVEGDQRVAGDHIAAGGAKYESVSGDKIEAGATSVRDSVISRSDVGGGSGEGGGAVVDDSVVLRSNVGSDGAGGDAGHGRDRMAPGAAVTAGPRRRTCAACQADISESARFCSKCGAPAPRLCASCSARLPGDARFCPECGAPAG
jgi:hypothetical protein